MNRRFTIWTRKFSVTVTVTSLMLETIDYYIENNTHLLEIAKKLYIPKKTKKFNKRKHRKEVWMTNDLLTKVVKKNELYVKWKKTPLTSANYELNKKNFKDHEKEVVKDILNAKRLYYTCIFNVYRSDMKKTWKTINETLSKINKF